MKNVLPYVGRKYDDTHTRLPKDNTARKMLSRKDSQKISCCLASSWLFVYKTYIFISSMYVCLSLLSALSKYFHCKRDQRTDNLYKLLQCWLPSKTQERFFSILILFFEMQLKNLLSYLKSWHTVILNSAKMQKN